MLDNYFETLNSCMTIVYSTDCQRTWLLLNFETGEQVQVKYDPDSKK